MPQPDGTQKAVEVHVFEESLRGTGEGHYPWDLMPNSTMTNGAVARYRINWEWLIEGTMPAEWGQSPAQAIRRMAGIVAH
jgi:hypothetical protein